MAVDVWLSLGSNLGDRVAYLEQGIALLQKTGVDISLVSSYYETTPFGPVPQDNFLNIVAKGSASLTPLALLENIHQMEASCGRQRLVRWGPRTLDIDILLYGDFISEQPELILPHPGIRVRAFVLVPWAEIGRQTQVPGLGTIGELLSQLPQEEQEKVWLYCSREQ